MTSGSFDSVEDLTVAMAVGNEQAVEVFYLRYLDKLYVQASKATRRDEAFCLDVVQESVLRVMRCIRRTKSESQLIAWLRIVVKTTAYDMLRAENRRKHREEIAATGIACGKPVLGEMENEEQLSQLRHWLERMDPQILQLIDMRFDKGWTLAKIAAATGLSVATVDGRLRRALSKLRNKANEVHDD